MPMTSRGTAALAFLLACWFMCKLEVAEAVCKDCEVIVNEGRLRVQALSPTLLRVEPRGPRGFEDRQTFTVVNRSFPGIPIRKVRKADFEVVVETDYYKIHLQPDVGCYWHVNGATGGQLFKAGDSLSRANLQTPFYKEPNKLFWPSPLSQVSYALVDSPRFVVPDWGPAPAPADVDPELRATNGFDFRNTVDGDTYIFLLGNSTQTWSQSRQEFLHLTGPTPVLPNYAYGTWFTRWHNYSQQEAMDEVMEWSKRKLPIDIWGLDMNWRNTSSTETSLMTSNVGRSDGSDWFYDHENTALFQNFSAWFAFLRSHGLKTYFNDHPYPVAARGAGGLQTSPEEVKFRWEGLTRWLGLGINFWWFDRNWRFSIPPPFVNTSRTGESWEGLDNAVWGSFIYYTTVKVFGERHNSKEPPLALTKFAPWDWQPGWDAQGQQEHPAHHRFPVWWTGDGVTMQASLESMVDAGLHSFKPFVHSDCQGFGKKSAGRYLRYLSHCAFGTILRLHGGDDIPWNIDDHVTDVVRSYLEMRYKLMPSLVAAGRRASVTGFPLVARGDFYWADHPESSSNHQYIYLDDMLVAPIYDDSVNVTTREVWIPPGEWEDAWNGTVVSGPAQRTVTLPYERLPFWHRRGGLVVLARDAGLRVGDQDWSSLVIDAFPVAASPDSSSTRRTVFEQDYTSEETVLEMTSEASSMDLTISPPTGNKAEREWLLRVHLLPGQRATFAEVDGGEKMAVAGGDCPCKHLEPVSTGDEIHSFSPLGGAGARPAPGAGPILELLLEKQAMPRKVRVTFESVGLDREQQQALPIVA